MRQPIRAGRQPTGSNSACSASHSRLSGSASRAASVRGEEAARSRSQAKLCNQSRVSADASALATLSDWICPVSPLCTTSPFIIPAPPAPSPALLSLCPLFPFSLPPPPLPLPSPVLFPATPPHP